MTFPEVLEQWAYWRRHPPTHELMAASVGFQPAPEPLDGGRSAVTVEDFARMVKATTGQTKYTQ